MITGWWAGDNDERYVIGPCKTRQEAIEEAIGQSCFNELEPEPPEHPDWRIAIYVCEADSPEMTDLTIDGRRVLEDVENANSDWDDPDGDGMFTDVTGANAIDLGTRLTAAFREWITALGLTLRYAAFQKTRHAECVVLPHPWNHVHKG